MGTILDEDKEISFVFEKERIFQEFNTTNNGSSCEDVYGSCVEKENTLKIYFVPITYGPEDDAFFRDVASFAQFINREYDIPYHSFVLVNKSMRIGALDCFNDRMRIQSIEQHFRNWYKEKYGEDETEPDKGLYRVIGVDKSNVCGDSSCGYTYFGEKTAYLKGTGMLDDSNCGQFYHVAAHELGHTFGLCDEYNPYIWENQNTDPELAPYGCPNEKPTVYNAYIPGGLEACVGSQWDLLKLKNVTTYPVCTRGIWIGRIDNIYSVMGDASVYDYKIEKLIKRQFTNRSKEHILKILQESKG